MWREDPRRRLDALSLLPVPLLLSGQQGARPQGGWCGQAGMPPCPGLGLPGHQGHLGQHHPVGWSRKLQSKEGRTQPPKVSRTVEEEGTGEGRGGRKRSWGVGDNEETKAEALLGAPEKDTLPTMGPVERPAAEGPRAGSAETAGHSSAGGSKWQQ